MPQTSQRPDHQHIDDLASLALSVAAQRNIDVVTEERTKAHVPTAPEFGDGFGSVGQIKVLTISETKDHAQTNGHIGITAEVKVELECKHDCR